MPVHVLLGAVSVDVLVDAPLAAVRRSGQGGRRSGGGGESVHRLHAPAGDALLEPAHNPRPRRRRRRRERREFMDRWFH